MRARARVFACACACACLACQPHTSIGIIQPQHDVALNVPDTECAACPAAITLFPSPGAFRGQQLLVRHWRTAVSSQTGPRGNWSTLSFFFLSLSPPLLSSCLQFVAKPGTANAKSTQHTHICILHTHTQTPPPTELPPPPHLPPPVPLLPSRPPYTLLPRPALPVPRSFSTENQSADPRSLPSPQPPPPPPPNPAHFFFLLRRSSPPPCHHHHHHPALTSFLHTPVLAAGRKRVGDRRAVS